MKASRFPREYIGFELETQKFLNAQELLARGVTLTGEGLPFFSAQPFDFVLLWFSGQLAHDNTKIYEGDICEMDVRSEFGSFIKKRAMMQWYPKTNQFILMMGSPIGDQFFEVANVKVIGHEFTDPELVAELKKAGQANG